MRDFARVRRLRKLRAHIPQDDAVRKCKRILRELDRTNDAGELGRYHDQLHPLSDQLGATGRREKMLEIVDNGIQNGRLDQAPLPEGDSVKKARIEGRTKIILALVSGSGLLALVIRACVGF